MAALSTDRRRFPDDIEYSILLRLPVKTLCRFKSACKSWLFLISSPQFQHRHYRHSQTKPLLFTVRADDEDPSSFKFSSYDSNQEDFCNHFSEKLPLKCEDLRPLQSCLGLVCLASEDAVVLCNPTTRELTSLPRGQGFTDCIGFSCVASTQELKVVRFFTDDNGSYCEVFIVGGSEWREAKNPPPYSVSYGAAPFVHGALHLLPDPLAEGVGGLAYIAAFDVESEEYRRIRLPKRYHRIMSTYSFTTLDYVIRLPKRYHRIMSTYSFTTLDYVLLTELRGSLCLTFDYKKMEGRLELWLLEDYNNVHWVKGFNINLRDFPSLLGIPLSWVVWTDVIGIMGDETIGDGSIMMSVSGNEMWYYDPKEKHIIQIIDDAYPAAFYVESLFHPKSYRGAIGDLKQE